MSCHSSQNKSTVGLAFGLAVFTGHDDPVDDEEVCGVCLDPVNDGRTTFQLVACDHLFHQECMKSWIGQCVQDDRCPQCPLCRKDITGGYTTIVMTPERESTYVIISEDPLSIGYGSGTFVRRERSSSLAEHIVDNLWAFFGDRVDHLIFSSRSLQHQRDSIITAYLDRHDPIQTHINLVKFFTPTRFKTHRQMTKFISDLASDTHFERVRVGSERIASPTAVIKSLWKSQNIFL